MMKNIVYFVGRGKKPEVRLCGMTIDSDGMKSQTSVFQSSDLLLVSWIREQIFMMDDCVGVTMYLLNPENDEMWKEITMKEFRELLVRWDRHWR
tara:strand:+ start:255 stop:536 length:282 start_codon:yes stop_codon:yes gene_type:complete